MLQNIDPAASKIIGIVGGMGPHSGLALFENILLHTKAELDQEHPSVILMSWPNRIVDRTEYLEGKTVVNPGYAIAKIIQDMASLGAEVIGLACNTAYAPSIYELILRETRALRHKIVILDIALETCKFLEKSHSKTERIGLMTTNGSYKTGVYKNRLEQMNFEVITPDPLFQTEVIHRMIYDLEFGIKANSHTIRQEMAELMDRAVRYFQDRAVSTIILGCTELPLIFKKRVFEGIRFIDPSDMLAVALLKQAGFTEKVLSVNFSGIDATPVK